MHQNLLKTLIILLISSATLGADNFMEFGDVNFGRDFKEKSKWILNVGGGVMQYPAVLPEFNGEHQSYDAESSYDVNGYSLSVGRDFYLGAGTSFSVGLGGFYAKTLDKITGKAASDIDFDYSEARQSFQISAYEATVALNYLFDFKVVDVQPFIEFGAGAGTSNIKIQYTTLGFGTNEANSSEDYDVTVDEKFATTRLSLGVNFISYKGLMSYFKVSTIQMMKSERKTKGESNLRGTATIVPYDSSDSNLDETETVGMVSVGIGSYF